MGFNNAAYTSLPTVSLTTIDVQAHEMGRLGAERLLDLINKKRGWDKPLQVVMEPKLIVRKSCGSRSGEEAALLKRGANPPGPSRQTRMQIMALAFEKLHWHSKLDVAEYLVPTSLEQALDMLASRGGKARVIAGGTDVIPELRSRKLDDSTPRAGGRIAPAGHGRHRGRRRGHRNRRGA